MRIVALPRDSNPYQEALYAPMRARGVPVSYAGALTPSRTLDLALLPAELAARRRAGADVLHVHWVFGFGLPGGARTARVSRAWLGVVLRTARALRMRVIWTAHNALPHAPVFPDDAEARRALVAACDLVIAHSPATLDALEEMGARPRRAVVIPHGPPAPAPPAPPAPRAADGTTRLLFIGKVLPYKGVEDLVAAVAAAPPRRPLALTVAGDCPDPALRARLGRLAEGSPHPVDLQLGFVPDAEVAARMAGADAVVLPFRRVTTSGSALLALAHGRPLVVPDLPGLRELPADAALRYDGSAAGLARAIASLAESGPGERSGRARAAAAHAAALPSWEEIAGRTLEAIRGTGA